MANTEDFLVEIGTEELPPADLQNLSLMFAELVQAQLIENHIAFAAEQVQIFATPRRLAVLIPKVVTQQPEQTVNRRGPAISAAYTAEGTPTKAALGFAESCGVDIKQVTTQKTDKGEWLHFSQIVPGKGTIELLPEFVSKAIQQLPIKKRMRWGNGDFAFVRPVQWVLMLFGAETVPATIFGITSSNVTYGHRIHHPEPIRIDIPSIYADKLAQEGFVIADFSLRQQAISEEIQKLAAMENATAVLDQDLLDLVTGLVEYPVALIASFAADFLRVPKECLISAMQDHQKCFALLDAQNNLLPKFILISNLKSTDPLTVIRGNELVMHARLADAAFHFDNDQKSALASRVPKLQTIVYQKQLGSLYDKVLRIQKFAQYLAPQFAIDAADIERAAYLCKADLLTNMVYEFPELQGIMGSYYALHDNEHADVAFALQDYYKPKSASDDLPSSNIGIILALADRIDTLVGFFGIGNIPTGEKDPFALRRQALGVLRILIEKNLDLDLRALIKCSVQAYADKIKDPTDELIYFCFERLKAWYASIGIQPNVFNAVLVNSQDRPLEFHRRALAVVEFLNQPEALNFSALNKRIFKILAEGIPAIKGNTAIAHPGLLTTNEEKALYDEICNQEIQIASLMQQNDYVAALKSISKLNAPIDNFFENVMVNVDDEKIKNNRKNLLRQAYKLSLQIADISLL